MNQAILDLLNRALALIGEHKAEILERCSDTAHAKFQSLETDVRDAVENNVVLADATVHPFFPALPDGIVMADLEDMVKGVVLGGIDHLSGILGARVAAEIRGARAEYESGQPVALATVDGAAQGVLVGEVAKVD